MMATHELYTPLPQASGRISPRMHPGNPITPVHSPHHSVTSSVSARTPVHTLTIHEYRRQQSTPVGHKTTPTGRTLRRKAAAPALGDVERVPSVSRSRPPIVSGPSSRPLRVSQSAQQLNTRPAPVQHEPLSDLGFRSQSVDPRTQGGSISSISTTNSGKLCHFNSRKRLPRPFAALGPISTSLSPPSTNPPQLRRSVLSPVLSFSTENLQHSAQTTPTPSTFSFSRFPQPPHHNKPPLSPSSFPPNDDIRASRTDPPYFSTTAPVTPPATPAIIHYRGASFDLVNPHDSLLFHDIVTPSKDFDSSDYLPLRTSEEPLPTSAEMAPKRPLYNDFSSARANILKHTEHTYAARNLDLPLPPTPAAVSPNSSSYTSPPYSPDSVDAPSPLAIKKANRESRFSLKQLTRTLSRKIGKEPEAQYGEELQDLRDNNVSFASMTTEGEYPRPLNYTYVAAPEACYSPLSPTSPQAPPSPMYSPGFGVLPPKDEQVKFSRRTPSSQNDLGQLTSMVPDDPSTQMGRMGNTQSLASPEDELSRPYYDDLGSIYASSSVYTGDGQRRLTYQQSLRSGAQSSPFLRFSGYDAGELASEYSGDNLYTYGQPPKDERQVSSAPTIELGHQSQDPGDGKTDTISKLIDEYSPGNRDRSGILVGEATSSSFAGAPQVHFDQDRTSSGFSQFQFDIKPMPTETGTQHEASSSEHDYKAMRRPAIGRDLGSPPHHQAPLAPAFVFNEKSSAFPRVDTSAMFSNDSSNSYGDTRNLLQIPPSTAELLRTQATKLEPSSSYSQSEATNLEPSSTYSQKSIFSGPHTPREALDQAEQIFDEARTSRSDSDIPAIWVKRSSASQLFSKELPDHSSNNLDAMDSLGVMDGAGASADWETIGRPSGDYRQSLGSNADHSISDHSIADYSDNDSPRNSLQIPSQVTFEPWVEQDYSQDFSLYGHAGQARNHSNPFTSTSVDLRSQAQLSDAPSSILPSSPPQPAGPNVIRYVNHEDESNGRVAANAPNVLTPWAYPYALSDKETEELLASGPNDKIIIDRAEPRSPEDLASSQYEVRNYELSSSPLSLFDDPVALERENTFDKFSVVGPKGNLTGTPHGTGMHEVGSSIAGVSSPGMRFSSSIRGHGTGPEFAGFYATPFPAIGSVTRIDHATPPPVLQSEEDRSPSQETLFPNEASIPSSPLDPNRRRSLPLRYSTTFKSEKRFSRSAVPGQTKLRQMVLAPAGRRTMSSADSNFSRAFEASGRPSTSDTHTPLRPTHPTQPRIDIFPPAVRKIIAHEDSPHLLCPERDENPEDEVRRKKLSWIILAAFCLIPPCIILFRWWGDRIMTSMTEGKLGHCTPQSKRTALIGGIVVNLAIVVGIVVPIVVLHAIRAV